MKIKAFLFTALLAIPTIAMADSTDKPAKTEKAAALTQEELDTMAHVKHVNDMEIEMGKLAKNGSARVKAFGATLVKDHTANNTKLMALAKKKGVTISDDEHMTPDQEKDHQAMMDGMEKLKTLKGAELDKELLTMAVEGHDKTLMRLDTAIASTKNGDLAKFLADTKIVVQRHADTARELQKKTTTSMK